MLLVMASIIVAHADELKVAGISVDLTKSGAVTGSGISGSVYYNADDKMLTLSDAIIDADGIGISANVSPGQMAFRVYLSGKNIINSGRVTVRADKSIIFCGNGELELNGPGNFINQCKMTVYACRLTVNSTADDAFHSMANGNADLELTYHGALKASCKKNVLDNFNDITYTTGALLSGGPAETEMTIGDDYKLKIGGVKVTPFNRDAVTGPNISGKVSVGVGQYVKVNLDNATISNSNYGIDFDDSEKDIVLALTGENTISASSRGLTGITGKNCGAYIIEGKSSSDKLTIKSPTGVSHQGDLNVKNCVLNIEGNGYGINLWEYGKLTADNATIHAKSVGSSGVAIGKLMGVTYLNGCTETEPLSSGYNNAMKGITDLNVNNPTLLKEVTIEPTYGVVVGGQILKKSMGSSTFNVTGNGISGTVTYSPAENALTLADGAELGFCGGKEAPATIEVLNCNAGIDDDNSFFTIKSMGTGHNTICDRSGSSGYAIFSYNDVRISGSAPLDIKAGYGVKVLFGHGMLIDLKADFTDEASYNNAFYSNSIYLPLTLAPDRNASYTYRFKSRSHSTFNFLSSLNMGSFSILSPKGAVYDSKEQNVVVDGSPVGPGQWVVFGNPQYADGYGLHIADKDPYIINQRTYPYLDSSFSTWCQQFYETWKKETHDIYHIYESKQDAVLGDYTHLLQWNGEVNLEEVLALHGNVNGATDVDIDIQEKGYRWKFEQEDYEIPVSWYTPVNDKLFAWLDGNVLKACYVTEDGKSDPGRQSRSSIGHEPLLKVQLLDQSGEVVTEGYIKFRIGEVNKAVVVKVDLSDAKQVSSGSGMEYRFNFDELEEEMIYAIGGHNIARAEFEANYCFAMNPSAPEEYYEMTFRDLKWSTTSTVLKPVQRYVKYRGTWIQAALQAPLANIYDTDRLGIFQMTFSDDNNYLSWTLTNSQREELGHEKVAVRLYDPSLTGFPDVYLVFAAKESPKGDANLDGVVDVADVATVIDAMASGIYDSDYDVNGDGVVDVADVATIIDLMAGQ